VNCSRTLAVKSQSGHWLGPVTQLGLLGPAQPIRAELDPAPKKYKNIK